VTTRTRPTALPATPPTVTVVIPHYNYGLYLPSAVASALDQPGVDVDVIIVDDASTDGSLAIARSIAASDDRITLVEHQTNLRHIGTYNDGLSRATGTYVVLLSADDALAPHSLARSAALMEANPGVGLVYGHARMIGDALPFTAETQSSWRGATETWTLWNGHEWLHQQARRGRNPIFNPEVMMRREVLERIGGYDARHPHSADLYLWLRAAARADVGRVNGAVQAYYRVHDGNMHTTQFGGLLDDYRAVRSTFDSFFEEDGHLLADARELHAHARRAIAREAVRRSALLAGAGSAASTDALLRFAEETDPADVWPRSAYRAAHRRGLGRPLKAVEQLRWKVRHHRDLMWGT